MLFPHLMPRQPHAASIAITQDDSDRAIYAALLFVALKKAQVPAELQIYMRGGHGYRLRVSDDPVST